MDALFGSAISPAIYSVLPPVLALLAAMAFAWNAFIQRRALEDTDAATGAFLSVFATAAVCWLIAPFAVQAEWWSSPFLWYFAAIGLIFPAAAQWMQIQSVGIVGPSLTSSLSALTPVFAVAAGIVWLGETVTVQAAFGVLLMVGGLALATWSPKGVARGWPIWALAIPLGAALTRGIAQPGLKYGMQHLPSPFFALLVGATVSALVLALMMLRHRSLGRMRLGKGAPRFLFVGLLNAAGILALNMALGLGTLAVVSPIVATTPLWTLALGVLVFKREVLGWRHLFVAVMVVAGGMLVLLR